MASMWTLGGLTWKDLAKRVWHEMEEDEVFGRAAQLSYYFLLALFPLLLFLTSLLGYFAEAGTELRENLLNYLGSVMPGSAYDLVHTTVDEISKAKSGGKLSFGILATLWAASNGMGAITESLNVAYNVKEQRSWWKVRLVSIGLTISLAVMIITALTLTLYGGEIGEKIAIYCGLGNAFTVAWSIIQWPIVLLFVMLSFSLIYYFAPDLRDQDWKWVTPGSLIALVLWLVVSFAFRAYLKYFDSYSATYGSLGAVIIMMLWFYLTGAAILIGGEINSEIENAAAEAGAPDAKERGEKAPDDNQKKSGNAKKKSASKGAKQRSATT
ncbi:MAG: YihY/virulence factor BrkB family protein [Pyrinomonadaceae bacterium]